MEAERQVIAQLERLIVKGKGALVVKRKEALANPEAVNLVRASQWKMSALNILHRAFGAGGIHSKEFAQALGGGFNRSSVIIGNNILVAAIDDMKDGYLTDLKELVEAEIFSDFMDQAEYLLSTGYYHAAAVVTGCVLEDALRKLCEHNSIVLPDKLSLDWMNTQLRKGNVYDLQTQKRVTANADIRNKAAHGEWKKFDKDDVKEMMLSVKIFMEKHFG